MSTTSRDVVETLTVLPLRKCTPDTFGVVGGKAKGLYRLMELGLPVPEGFAISADAYRACVSATGIASDIESVLADPALTDTDKSSKVIELFTRVEMPVDLSESIEKAYFAMGSGPVAVRSSGIAEDTAAASFAGQHDTYLWIEGADNVKSHVLKCWASLFNSSAIGYRAKFDIPAEDVAMGVVVQKMVPAVAGGVMMTLEPVTGDNTVLHIDAAHGLGEGVVVGDVQSDQFQFGKENLDLLCKRIGRQESQYIYDESVGTVVLRSMDPHLGAQPALSDEIALDLARLGLTVEQAFGMAMDIEWAVSDGQIHLLQARPETVWSERNAALVAAARGSATHGDLNPDHYYSTANLGEAAPGVLSPLTWSVWGVGAEVAARYGFVQMGVLEKSEANVPKNPHDRIIQVAYGRAVASVSAFYDLGERIPGASGAMLAEQLLGSVPDGMLANPTKRRYPHVMVKMPKSFIGAKSVIDGQHAKIARWWQRELARTPHLDINGARAQFADAVEQFLRSTAVQAVGNMIAVPPVFSALEKLVTDVGMDEYYGVLSSGGDHTEVEGIADLWDLGRGRLSEEEFLNRHGFHGTLEGDIAGTVWREDPTPIRRMAQMYAAQDDGKDPRTVALRRVEEKKIAKAELMSRLGVLGRFKARLILKLVQRHMPLRGIGKASFLRSLDIARASARRIGSLLVADGVLDAVDDIMYLTADELTAPSLPENVRALVAERKAEQALFRSIEIPAAFWGQPAPRTAKGEGDELRADENSDECLTGIGASAGIVEGRVRVVTDPAFTEVEPGEILVATTTDPSWASIMFVSAGLIVDIGGVLSHAAVVARELHLPCVVNTGTGTSVLRTGDRVRVNGRTGVVEILERVRTNTENPRQREAGK
ncbi:PEP/pyruvate-binding domain-containing protein [Rhodococcus sp. ZPP]|uniref:PEP/pyruvate-binding domain-containing protein n=1 Tax=Rhodococcus sp. ZPP TaxID=2749906 RepID=UPI001FCCD308|nr:PEP/pyruvate-binding domain-containing protein [Rhodococcus sp. ZPP]